MARISFSLPRRRWLTLWLAPVVWFCAGAAAKAADPGPLTVCLVSGSLEYESNKSLAALQKYLESNYHVKCTRAFIEGEDETRLPGLENLASCDVALLFTRRLKLSGKDLERIKSYCTSGKPLVGVRTASHAVQTWLDLDKEVLGGNYKGHYRNDLPTDVSIVAAEKDSPLLAGVRPFRSAGSLYKNQGLAGDCRVLMQGTSPEATEPITWTRAYKGGRIFYTALGHQKDFEEESFRRLLANALFWTAGREPQPRKGN
jgi:type 1 glutamine amidotransferase